MIRVIQPKDSKAIAEIMRVMRVDPYGVKIMSPKADFRVIRTGKISNIAANILKQEMLSLGAEAAVSRGALTGQDKETECLLLGNSSQYASLLEKLKKQPFGLDALATSLKSALENSAKEDFRVPLGKSVLRLSKNNLAVMGIMNLTPDSFSGDGLLGGQRHKGTKTQSIVEFAQKLVVKDGADILDLGGESSRPGAKPIALKEELSRVIPALKKISRKIKIPLSVDTYKPEVARAALDNGAEIINDITALKDPKMLKVVSRYRAAVILMHMRGTPRSMQKNTNYQSVILEILEFLSSSAERAMQAGIKKEKIIIDPGIGFGKSCGQNFEIISKLSELKSLGFPILIGSSRKSFLKGACGDSPRERIPGTIASCVLAAQNGARIFRVHDVAEVKSALKVSEVCLS